MQIILLINFILNGTGNYNFSVIEFAKNELKINIPKCAIYNKHVICFKVLKSK